MIEPANDRILGLSSRARRFVVPCLTIAAAVDEINYFSSKWPDDPLATDTGASGNEHAVGYLEPHILVFEHGGAGSRPGMGGWWTQIGSPDDNDVPRWASTGSRVLAGGHARGLRR